MNPKQPHTKGGKRAGAGRPKGRNAYGEATQPVHIPLSLLDPIEKLLQDFSRLRQSTAIIFTPLASALFSLL